MKIAVTAPRKGLGQTVTSILLGDMLAKKMDGLVNMVDLNHFYTDLDYYLSKTGIARGLDDFQIFHAKGDMTNEMFMKRCTQKVMNGLYLSSSRRDVSGMTRETVQEFTRYNEENFNGMVIDSLSGVSKLNASKYFLEEADVIVVIINQNMNVIRLLEEYTEYSKYDAKVVFVLNQYVNGASGVKVGVDLAKVRDRLKKFGLEGEVFALPLSLHLMNESNDKSVLNFTNSQMDQTYIQKMDEILDHIFEITGFDVEEEKERLEVQKSLNSSDSENDWKKLFKKKGR